MTEETFRIQFGSIEHKTFHKFENGRMVSYYYSIERNRNGREISRTEPTRLGILGYDYGSDFTEDDYNLYKHGIEKPKKGFFARLFNA